MCNVCSYIPKAQFKLQKLQTIVVLLNAFQMATILLVVLIGSVNG